MIGTRQMFYARLPEVKGTAGGVAFPARRGDAREPGLSLDAQPHDAASTIRWRCSRPAMTEAGV